MKRLGTLTVMILILAWLAPEARAGVYPSEDITITCSSDTFKALMNTQVNVPQRDLAVPAYVLHQVRILGYGKPGCPTLMQGTTYEQALLQYVEYRWIEDATGELPTSAATVGEAIRSSVQRALSVTDYKADTEQFFARRRLAYRKTFKIEVPEPQSAASAWSQNIAVRIVNVGLWPMQWQVRDRPPPELWFEPTPDAMPTKFYCKPANNDWTTLSAIAPGRRVDLSCQQQAPQADRQTQAPDAAALANGDSWVLHFPILGNMAFYADQVDVALGSTDVLRQADYLIHATSCSDRGSCDIDRSTGETRRDTSLGVFAYWTYGLGAFAIGLFAFFFLRFVIRLSARSAATALSLLLVLGMLVLTAFLYLSVKGPSEGLNLMGIAAIWLAALLLAACTLAGIWIGWLISARQGESSPST